MRPPRRGLGDKQATILVTVREVKIGLSQALLSEIQSHSRFHSLFSEETGQPLLIINGFAFKCCHARWQARSLSEIEVEAKCSSIPERENFLPSPAASSVDVGRDK